MPGSAAIGWVSVVNNLLLDNYPSAAAYSLRRLRTAYSGNAIRIRRSNDNAEQDIGFSSNTLDTAAISSFVGSNNAFVTTWYDQSGNGVDLTQTTAGKQPIIVTSGTLEVQGSNPKLRFDGARTMRTSAGQLNFGTLDSYITMQATTNNTVLFGLPHASTHIDPYFRYSIYYFSGFYVRFNGTESAAGGANTNYNIFNLNSATGDLYVNATRTLDASGVTLTYPNSVPFLLGSNVADTELLTGNVFELIIYSSDQTSNRTAIVGNINNYYTIY